MLQITRWMLLYMLHAIYMYMLYMLHAIYMYILYMFICLVDFYILSTHSYICFVRIVMTTRLEQDMNKSHHICMTLMTRLEQDMNKQIVPVVVDAEGTIRDAVLWYNGITISYTAHRQYSGGTATERDCYWETPP